MKRKKFKSNQKAKSVPDSKEKGRMLSKKELAKLKDMYKKGNLKFDSRKVAEGILEDLRNS